MTTAHFLVLPAVLGLAACASSGARHEPAASTMRIGGDAYVISQITASTWSATANSSTSELGATSPNRSAVLSEIERLSGCKVSHSDYSRQTRQLDAQVVCAGQLKN